ncbi:unnamed protein product [Acanthosepion pharaonis]|uniref:Uncharacterized protein n=1 Tax=Acanthosepion pharaonis TaxID=158019 RepID=A0A812CI87_ACAPH|nr:unnamed protein product [Sepia pharaonis]
MIYTTRPYYTRRLNVRVVRTRLVRDRLVRDRLVRDRLVRAVSYASVVRVSVATSYATRPSLFYSLYATVSTPSSSQALSLSTISDSISFIGVRLYASDSWRHHSCSSVSYSRPSFMRQKSFQKNQISYASEQDYTSVFYSTVNLLEMRQSRYASVSELRPSLDK